MKRRMPTRFAEAVDQFEKRGEAYLRHLLDARLVRDREQIAVVKAALARIERRQQRDDDWGRVAAGLGRRRARALAAWTARIASGMLAAGVAFLAMGFF